MLIRALFIIVILFYSLTSAEEALKDNSLENRALNLFKTIKCQVCVGESIYDSRADIAKAMRANIRNQIMQGKTDQQVKDYLVSRYGEQILFNTPYNNIGIVIWLIPLILLISGLIIIIKRVKLK